MKKKKKKKQNPIETMTALTKKEQEHDGKKGAKILAEIKMYIIKQEKGQRKEFRVHLSLITEAQWNNARNSKLDLFCWQLVTVTEAQLLFHF
jgi:uncharacterized protein involved in exopolysaccharide biosynthesis